MHGKSDIVTVILAAGRCILGQMGCCISSPISGVWCHWACSFVPRRQPLTQRWETIGRKALDTEGQRHRQTVWNVRPASHSSDAQTLGLSVADARQWDVPLLRGAQGGRRARRCLSGSRAVRWRSPANANHRARCPLQLLLTKMEQCIPREPRNDHQENNHTIERSNYILTCFHAFAQDPAACGRPSRYQSGETGSPFSKSIARCDCYQLGWVKRNSQVPTVGRHLIHAVCTQKTDAKQATSWIQLRYKRRTNARHHCDSSVIGNASSIKFVIRWH